MILFADSKLFNEVAPLRAMWAPIGQQAPVPIVAAHAVRILTGVLNIRSGHYLTYISAHYKQENFQVLLR